jgi:hypothetical protein
VTEIIGEHGGRGGRVEGTMMEEPERGLPEKPKVDLDQVRAASGCFRLSVRKPHKTRGKSLPFSWPVHRYSDSRRNC